MSKHTPGPWEFHGDDTIISAGGRPVASAEMPEDARLIAAAPEMLEQLDYVTRLLSLAADYLDEHFGQFHLGGGPDGRGWDSDATQDVLTQARSIIAKAGGKP